MEFMARDLRLATKAVEDNGVLKLVTTIRMEGQLSPEVIAELARCQKDGLPLRVTLESAQLSFGQPQVVHFINSEGG